jgi:ABC-2 type transport system permease protein
MRRIGLIAAREIGAYASAPSFWIALLIGPLLMMVAGLAGLAGPTPGKPPAQTVAVRAADPALETITQRALSQSHTWPAPVALATEGADTVLSVARAPSGLVELKLEGRSLPAASSALLERDVLAALRLQALQGAGVSPQALQAVDSVRVKVLAPPAVAPNPDTGPRIGRFALVMLLWMNLVGALGMLLQAIVRERSNRTLESLLASVRPSEIIFGKLLGVGALSAALLAAWLGSGAFVANSPLGGQGQGFLKLLLAGFGDPASLARAAMVYLLAFVMFGAALIGLGAAARDLPTAQNLSRPVFAVLLVVFFTALAQVTGAVACEPWMLWVPPLTPFVTLMTPPAALGATETVTAFAVMGLTALGAAVAASRTLTEQPWPWTRRLAARAPA